MGYTLYSHYVLSYNVCTCTCVSGNMFDERGREWGIEEQGGDRVGDSGTKGGESGG